MSGKSVSTDSGAPKIRVCQFAKEESIHANRASPSPSDHVPIENVEVITLSSEDEAKPSLQPPLRKTKRKPKQKRKINCPISKAPLQYNYHKITEYFGITKVERKNSSSSIGSPDATRTEPAENIDDGAHMIPVGRGDDKKVANREVSDTEVAVNVNTRRRKANVIRDDDSVIDLDCQPNTSAAVINVPSETETHVSPNKKSKIQKNKRKCRPRNPRQTMTNKNTNTIEAPAKPTIEVVKQREVGATTTKELRVVLKRLDVIKRFDFTDSGPASEPTDQQAKITSYINGHNKSENYFAVHNESVMPAMVRIEKSNSVAIEFHMPLKMEITETQSPSQIEFARVNYGDASRLPTPDTRNATSNAFPPGADCSTTERSCTANIDNKRVSRKTSTSKVAKGTRTKPICPSYKIVEGTRFAVDAFRYGDIDGVKHYFLTHYHADHYIGLKKSFCQQLYVSEITGRLVIELSKVQPQYIHMMKLGKPKVIDETEVIALEANHCPGAVMFLFKLTTGKCILHTGDFRANPSMEEYPEFWSNNIDTVYLDTTYLSKSYDFDTQNDSIQKVLHDCETYLERNLVGQGKTLIVCGAYVIGKEKVWLSIAQHFNFKVFVEKGRRKTLDCIGNRDMLDVLVDSPLEANIHVLSINQIGYKRLVEYLNMYGEHFTRLLAFRPSGWEKNTKPSIKSRVAVVGVQYSEHSSYNELHRFIRFLRPRQVISTVPFSTKYLERTPKIPQSWLGPLKPLRQSIQTNIKNFMQVKEKELPEQMQNDGCVDGISLDDSGSDWMS